MQVSTEEAWTNASIAASSKLYALQGKLPAKSTPHLEVTEYINVTNQVELAPGHWFFDFGTDFMGGIHLELPPSFDNKTLQLTLSEELISNTSILWPMRTGNNYTSMVNSLVSRTTSNANCF